MASVPSEGLAPILEPPYWAVIFTSERSDVDEGYDDTARRMVELAADQPGFLGVESVRDGEVGITVSYWASQEAIARWRRHPEHREARRRGRDEWYRRYRVRVAKVERSHGADAVEAGGEERSEADERRR